MLKFPSLKSRLVILFLILVMIPVVIIAYLTFTRAKIAIQEESFNKLTAIREIKKRQIENYFKQVRSDLYYLSTRPWFINSANDLKKSYFESEIDSKNSDYYGFKMNEFYRKDFYESISSSNQKTLPIENLFPKNDRRKFYQYHFVANKGNLISSLHPYYVAHTKADIMIKEFTKTFKYYDVMILDDATGECFYNTNHEADEAVSMKETPFKDFISGKIFDKALKIDNNVNSVISDFEIYYPSRGIPSMFVAKPIYEGNKRIAILIMQVSIDVLNEVMTNQSNWLKDGLGMTGESFMVGKDGKMRSDARALKDNRTRFFYELETIKKVDKSIMDEMKFSNSSILFNDVNSPITEKANKGISSTEISTNYLGKSVLTSFTPLEIEGLSWNLVCEIEEQETFESIILLRNILFIMLIVIFILVIFLSFKVANYIANPILDLSQKALMVQAGDLEAKANEVESPIEVKNLVNAFNGMVFSIKDKQIQLQEMVEEIGTQNEELKQNQEELMTQQEAVMESKNVAESASKVKSEFLANMSHEIRTPMNAVLGFAELLNDMVDDPMQKGYIKNILSSGKNLLGLINDILDLSKIESGKFEIQLAPTNPQGMFEEIISVFTVKTTEKNLDLKLDIDKSLPESLLLDELRLRQVIFNLVGNAIKFTSEGSVTLRVVSSYKKKMDSLVDVKFEIIDTGIGIPQKDINKIFEAFTQQEGQENRKFGGTGLGLTITKRLVELMGGKLELESELGKGSVFRVCLYDISVGVMQQKMVVETINDNIHFNNASILLVDDIAMNREVVKGFLRPFGLHITEAENGKIAIEKLKSQSFEFVFMDIKMPVMDGYEAKATIDRIPELAHIPIIALTAQAMKDDQDRIRDLKFNDYLTKPVSKQALLSCLSKFLKTEVGIIPSNISISNIESVKIDSKQIINDKFVLSDAIVNKAKLLNNELSAGGFNNEDLMTLLEEIKQQPEYESNKLLHIFVNDLSFSIQSFDLIEIPKLLKKLF